MSNPTTKFHPILFSTPMIQAIIEGKKTQTRRVVKLPRFHPFRVEKQIKMLTIKDWILYDGNNENIGTIKENYKVGDVLWARETFASKEINEEPPGVKAHYFASDSFASSKWKPSIHMPKEFCRIFLKVKSVRIERLMDIREEDAKKEGVKMLPNGSYRNYHEEESEQNHKYTKEAKPSFITLWESIYGTGTWEFNPYVFVYEYERIEKPLDFIV